LNREPLLWDVFSRCCGCADCLERPWCGAPHRPNGTTDQTPCLKTVVRRRPLLTQRSPVVSRTPRPHRGRTAPARAPTTTATRPLLFEIKCHISIQRSVAASAARSKHRGQVSVRRPTPFDVGRDGREDRRLGRPNREVVLLPPVIGRHSEAEEQYRQHHHPCGG
jgi:hypothetical protein